jgi:hypothetical protein
VHAAWLGVAPERRRRTEVRRVDETEDNMVNSELAVCDLRLSSLDVPASSLRERVSQIYKLRYLRQASRRGSEPMTHKLTCRCALNLVLGGVFLQCLP